MHLLFILYLQLLERYKGIISKQYSSNRNCQHNKEQNVHKGDKTAAIALQHINLKYSDFLEYAAEDSHKY